jgi:hypothetical protein
MIEDGLTTGARDAIAKALRDAGLPAHSYVPETVSPPAVIVIPDDPYIVVNRLGPRLSYSAAFTVTVMVQALDNEASLALCEAHIDAVLDALPSGVSATRVSRPALDDLGAQGAVYVAEVNVTAQVERTP